LDRVEIVGSGVLMANGGRLIISLDFELMWGVRDNRSVADYGRNILGVRKVVPALLKLFSERKVGCTWATVGLLFFANKREMLAGLPDHKPRYRDMRFSPYSEIAEIGDSEDTDPYWYGQSMIKQIMDCSNQEIGTHTFSHFYCLEDGGTPEMLDFDLQAAQAAAARLGINLESIAFPRNQYSCDHLRVCRDRGLRTFRGNESVWFHAPSAAGKQSLPRRGFRLADSYLPLGGAWDNYPEMVEGLIDVRSSRFLRPARARGILEDLRLRRITSAMDAAAQRGTHFHLWWHPHNFGANLLRNLEFLTAILDHFRILQDRFGMQSMTMGQIAREAQNV
jgi:hypothetical protein